MIELHPEILSTEGQPRFAVLPYDEYLQVRDALARLTAGLPEPDPRYGGFHDNLSAVELATRQGVQPVTDPAALAWPFEAQDWAGFEEAVDEWRHGNGHAGANS